MAEEQLFAAFLDKMYHEVDDATTKVAEKAAVKFQKKLAEANKSFFTILASKIVNAPYAPDLLGGKTQRWEPLSDQYLRWKFKTGRQGGFFRAYNDLSQQLQHLDYSDLLGAPEVTYFAGSTSGSKDVVVKVNKRGTVYARNTRTNRFASFDDVYKKMPSSISTDAFPNLDLKGIDLSSRSGLLEQRVLGSYANVMYKMAGRAIANRRGVLRPILGAYMQWWIEAKIRPVIEGK